MTQGVPFRKKLSIKPVEFFKKIASRANYLNKEIVEEVYREMVRVIVQELKDKGEIELPDLVLIYAQRRIPHKIMNIQTRKIEMTSNSLAIRMRIDNKIRRFFNIYGKEHQDAPHIPPGTIIRSGFKKL